MVRLTAVLVASTLSSTSGRLYTLRDSRLNFLGLRELLPGYQPVLLREGNALIDVVGVIAIVVTLVS